MSNDAAWESQTLFVVDNLKICRVPKITYMIRSVKYFYSYLVKKDYEGMQGFPFKED